jgi:hypothetical protein
MRPEQHEQFPVGPDFLTLLQGTGDAASNNADEFMKNSGRLGNLLSYLYRLSCGALGCSNGDYVLEWLATRVVNQAMAAIGWSGRRRCMGLWPPKELR